MTQPKDPIEYHFTLRHIQQADFTGHEEGDMVLACRDEHGRKVAVHLEGMTPGMILDYFLSRK